MGLVTQECEVSHPGPYRGFKVRVIVHCCRVRQIPCKLISVDAAPAPSKEGPCPGRTRGARDDFEVVAAIGGGNVLDSQRSCRKVVVRWLEARHGARRPAPPDGFREQASEHSAGRFDERGLRIPEGG